jgi:hypothetical protein
VEKGVELHIDDTVEYYVVWDPRQRDYKAVELKVLQAATSGRRSMRKKEEAPITVLRQPSLPDGTKGFGTGRGKFSAEDRKKLVDSLAAPSGSESPRVQTISITSKQFEDAVQEKKDKEKKKNRQ